MRLIMRVAVLILAALAPTLSAASTPLSLTYDLSSAGFPVLSLKFEVKETENSYHITGLVRSVGISDLFSRYVLRTESEGTVTSGQLRPGAYISDSHSRLRHRFASIRFRGDGSILTFLAPPEDRSDTPPTEQQIKGSLDPLTGMLQVSHILARLDRCDAQIPVFDGRRRYQLTLSDEGIEHVPASSDHAYAGVARRCRVDMTKIAGFSTGSVSNGEDIERALMWMAVPVPGAPPLPIRIEFSGRLGPTKVWLVAVQGSR